MTITGKCTDQFNISAAKLFKLEEENSNTLKVHDIVKIAYMMNFTHQKLMIHQIYLRHLTASNITDRSHETVISSVPPAYPLFHNKVFKQAYKAN